MGSNSLPPFPFPQQFVSIWKDPITDDDVRVDLDSIVVGTFYSPYSPGRLSNLQPKHAGSSYEMTRYDVQGGPTEKDVLKEVEDQRSSPPRKVAAQSPVSEMPPRDHPSPFQPDNSDIRPKSSR